MPIQNVTSLWVFGIWVLHACMPHAFKLVTFITGVMKLVCLTRKYVFHPENKVFTKQANLIVYVCVRNTDGWYFKYYTSPVSTWCVESVVVTEYSVSLHSLGGNKISDCSSLCGALQECKELRTLRWVWSDSLLIIPHPHTQSGIMLHTVKSTRWELIFKGCVFSYHS